MKRPYSLKTRLLLVILLPLIALTSVASTASYRLSYEPVQSLYDDTLSVVTLTIIRDVVLTEGDLLAEDLLDRLVGALGDPIFYRVEGPNGRFVTGYPDPPRTNESTKLEPGHITFFDAQYLGDPVRVAVMREFISTLDYSGWTTVQVWQTVNRRELLRQNLTFWTLGLMFLVLFVSTLTVWLGIQFGLRPLNVMREALLRRSPTDLRPIRQLFPREIQPMIDANNTLLNRMTDTLTERDSFISNAAHQLRNPIAAIQAQAEAAANVTSDREFRSRSESLARTAKQVGRLTGQLLSIDRAANQNLTDLLVEVDFRQVVSDVLSTHAPDAMRNGTEVTLQGPNEQLVVQAEPMLLAEAIENLVDNALRYGCTNGGRLAVTLGRQNGAITASFCDDGPGIPDEHRHHIFDRFQRASGDDQPGCGLGLSISRVIARRMGGDVVLKTGRGPGTCMEIRLPDQSMV